MTVNSRFEQFRIVAVGKESTWASVTQRRTSLEEAVPVDLTSYKLNAKYTVYVVWQVLALRVKVGGTKQCNYSENFRRYSDRIVRGLQHFVCGNGVVRWKIITHKSAKTILDY